MATEKIVMCRLEREEVILNWGIWLVILEVEQFQMITRYKVRLLDGTSEVNQMFLSLETQRWRKWAVLLNGVSIWVTESVRTMAGLRMRGRLWPKKTH